MLGASFAMLIVLLILLPEGVMSRNPIYRIAFYLGEISYGIYLWHLPVILLLKKSGLQNPPVFLITTLMCVVMLSAISWHFIEKPVIRWSRNRPAIFSGVSK